MSVFRFGRSLVRSFCKQFTDRGKTLVIVVLIWSFDSGSIYQVVLWSWFVGFKGSGKVAAKSGLGSGGEISEGHRASVRQLAVASRASQKYVSLFRRSLWKGFTSAVTVTQAASLRRKFNPWVSSFKRLVGSFSIVSLLSTKSFFIGTDDIGMSLAEEFV